MAVHPQGKRPRSWFGPDDYTDGDDVDAEIAKRHCQQDEWDDIYFQMPLWKRILSTFIGEDSEPSDHPREKRKPTVKKDMK